MRAAMLALCAWLSVANAQKITPPAGAVPLQPASFFRVAPTDWKLRDLRIDGDGVWSLIQAPAGSFSIVRTSLAGHQSARVDFPAEERVLGVVSSNSGVAAMVVRNRKLSLDRFDRQGKTLGRTPLQCGSGDQLLLLDGEVATVCPDGQITRHLISQPPERYTSWARPGSLTEALRDRRLLIADRLTGKLLFNNLDTGALFSPSHSSPEIAQAVAHIDHVMKSADARPGEPPLARSLVVMDTATDGNSIGLLVWPFHPDFGVAVVVHAGDGSVAGRFVCPMPPALRDATPHKLEMNAKLLAIGVTGGEVVIYRYKE